MTTNKITLINEGSYTFFEVDTEEYRIYKWGNGSSVRIESPAYVSVNPNNGGHRILDMDGMSHYIPTGWIQLSWKSKEGAPHFVK